MHHQRCLIRDDDDRDDNDDKDEDCDGNYHRSILGITSAGYKETMMTMMITMTKMRAVMIYIIVASSASSVTFEMQIRKSSSQPRSPPMSRSILCITNRHARTMLVMLDTFSCHTMPFYLVKKKQLSAPLSTPPRAAVAPGVSTQATMMMVMIRVRPVMITIIAASSALPMVSNVTVEMRIRIRKLMMIIMIMMRRAMMVMMRTIITMRVRMII